MEVRTILLAPAGMASQLRQGPEEVAGHTCRVERGSTTGMCQVAQESPGVPEAPSASMYAAIRNRRIPIAGERVPRDMTPRAAVWERRAGDVAAAEELSIAGRLWQTGLCGERSSHLYRSRLIGGRLLRRTSQGRAEEPQKGREAHEPSVRMPCVPQLFPGRPTAYEFSVVRCDEGLGRCATLSSYRGP